METRANYAAVGAFVFAMVLLAFGAVVWLAGGQLNAPKAYYRIYFSGLVSGMREGAAVEFQRAHTKSDGLAGIGANGELVDLGH